MALGTADDYAAQVEALKRRREVAQQLAQSAAAPWDTQMVGGVVVQHSPWEGVAQLGKALIARKAQQNADHQEQDLRGQRASDIAQAMSQAQGASQDPAVGPQGRALAQQNMRDTVIGPEDSRKIMIAQELSAQKDKGPNSVQEYEYARKNGFAGSFQDWIAAGGQSSRPSAVQEWEFYNKLPSEMQPRYLEMKRNPNFVVKDVNQVPTVIHPTARGTTTTALSNLGSEAAAAGTIKQSEAQAGQLGEALGKVQGAIQTKGANAVSTQNLLDLADPLIDQATGSAAGAAVDATGRFVGKSTEGAQAIAQLKVLESGLMMSMPRMEGPQSDKDVANYRQAAAQIGDPTVPRAQKKAALGIIRQIQQSYVKRAQQAPGMTPPINSPPAAQPTSDDALLSKWGQ